MRDKKLLRNRSFRTYYESINHFIKQPMIFLPFLISNLIPLIIVSLMIQFVGGPEVADYYYSTTTSIIVHPEIQNKLFLSLVISAVISVLMASFFDATGIIMCSDKKNISLKGAMNKAKKHWLNMTITLIVLILIGILLVYPALFLVTIGAGSAAFLFYGLIASILFALMIIYPRVITINEKVSGFDAVSQGIKFLFSNLSFNIVNFLIILIVVVSTSLFMLISPALSLFINSVIIFPWINLFIVKAYQSKD